MNVYIWTSWELKNAYIGEVVSYSADFRWSSQSAIESWWWSFIIASWWISFSSEWVKQNSNTSSTRIYRTIDLTNRTSIHCEWTGKLVDWWGQWDGVLYLIVTNDISNTWAQWVRFWPTKYDNSSAKWVWFRYNWSEHFTWTALPAWEYSYSLDIDLTTWNMVGTVSWAYSATMTWTLTSTYLNYIKTSWIYIGCQFDISYPIYKTMSFEIS